MYVEELLTPALIVNYDALLRNITRMARRAKEFGVDLRPHIKTHKCIEIADLQQKMGAKGFTVATVYEAQVFADAGFEDITLAMPLALDKFPIISELARKITLNVLVDHPLTVEKLAEFMAQEKLDIEVLVKVDVGYHRCGVDPDDPAAIHLVEQISKAPHLHFKGLLTHGGDTYDGKSVEEVRRAAQKEQQKILLLAKRLGEHDPRLAPETVSIGSTPSMSLTEEMMDGITEIRPGNYVFHDYEQVALGSCGLEDCALRVLASVIGVYDDRIVVDAGATALSVDPGPRHIEPDCGYGKIVTDEGRLITGLRITGLSQEHGKIAFTKGMSHTYEPGMKLQIVPNHSCLTANLDDVYNVVSNGEVIKQWKIHRGHIQSPL
ncbi:MAG: alanine racemase [Candidatus Thorarchaeota archaeon]|nr:alanine racemase [Candidatus Thorarchaeota archaeon]